MPRARFGKHGGERIERRGLPREFRGSRFEGAAEIGVAAAAHLHQQGIESLLVSGRHERGDRARAGQ
jgi:hypothetical protein